MRVVVAVMMVAVKSAWAEVTNEKRTHVRTVDFGFTGFAVTQNFYFLSCFQCACRNSPGDDGASENNLKSRPKLDIWVELKLATIALLFSKNT